MRKRLMAAVAFAPLTLMGLQPAFAQTTISNTQTTPVLTSTAGDVTVASGGTLGVTASGAAATINSNNSVTNNGTITSNDVNNLSGILVQSGAFTGSITNTGTIALTESYTPSDSVNTDGIAEAPFALGTGRIAIQTVGTLTGTITNSGTISVQGNNSSGISIGGKLNGSFTNTGTIAVTGDNSVGIITAGEVTGTVQVSNSVIVKGLNATGVQTTGKIDGSLTFYGSVSSTGYALDSRSATTTALQKIEATPTDVEQGGSAILIQNSVVGGVFLGAPPATTNSADTTTDADGDGIVDSVEGTTAINTSGSSPAIQIGGPSAITIGNFNAANPYGLTIEGTITSNGVYDGVAGTGIDIGVGGKGVNLTGGINITGSVNSTAYQANATAMHLENGAVVPTLRNSGQLASSVTSAGGNTSTALLIDAGATLKTIANYGSIVAAAAGDNVNASVIIDRSGTLTYVENTGFLEANITAAAPGETINGRGIALDLSANTTGVTIHQELDGATAPAIIGDILLGNGPNTVQFLSGTVQGSLSLGNGASSLTLDNGAAYLGALTYGGTKLVINVSNGKLQNTAATTINASSLTVGAAGYLAVALDPQKNTSGVYNVSGAVKFAAGAQIGATLLSTPLTSTTFTIIKAGSLSLGSSDTALFASLPYLFTGSLKSNVAAGTISLTVATKSAADLGLNKAEAASLPAILAALPQDTNIQTSIVSSANRANFIPAYDQLLPSSSGDVFQTALNMSKAISRATADRFDLSTQSDDDDDAIDTTGTWISEFYTGVEQSKGDNNAFHSAGLGVIGGVDFGGYGGTFSLGSANIVRPGSGGSDSLNSVSRIEGGFYAAPRFGPISIDARVGAGYLNIKDRRQFIASILAGDLSTVTTVSRTANGNWSGYDLSGHIGAGIQANLSPRLFVQPKIYADFFHTHEGAYNESGGGNGFNLSVLGRDGTQTSATASVLTGMKFGKSFILSPQLELGYDQIVQGGPGSTTAHFLNGANFTVAPNAVGGAGMARFVLKGDGNYVHFSFQGGGEFRNGYHALDLRAVFRLTY